MFNYQGGQKIVVGEGFVCQLPPIPSKELIIGYNKPREEQFWQRQQVPSFYLDRSLEEEYKREQDLDAFLAGKKKTLFVDPVLERYRRQEWIRRIYGCWFMNDGEPTYLTNHHYFYLQYGKADHKTNDGYPSFYEFSRDNFYIRQWCETNSHSLGYVMVASRGTGKSQEEIACLLNRATFKHAHRAAIQGKHYEDSKKFIESKVTMMFNALPKFFKPAYSHGTFPKNELVFTRPSTRGKSAASILFGPDTELSSTIFAAQPGEKVLDGDTLGDSYATEIGKTNKDVADIYERHLVNSRTVVRNHEKVGIMREETTVEEMKEGGEECLKLWKASDSKVLDGNGFTKSKIHRHFISALDTDTSTKKFMCNDLEYDAPCNKYGKVDRKLAGIKIQADLDGVKHDLKELSARMRKSPRNEAEAFIPDQSKSIFNIQLITARINKIRNEMTKRPYVKGNFYWVTEKFGEVWFKPDDHAGRFNVSWFPDEYQMGYTPGTEGGPKKLINNWTKKWGYDREGNSRLLVVPGNDHLFRAATDPIKYTFTKDPRASKAAIHAFRLYDHMIDGGRPRKDWETHKFVIEYCNRPDNPATYLEDLAMMCMFLGCKVLPERNIPDVNYYFETNGLQELLAYPKDWIQGEDALPIMVAKDKMSEDAGLASTKPVIDYYTKRLIPFINDDIERCDFDDTIEDWSLFDPNDPTKSHLTVSSGFCLVHNEKVAEVQKPIEANISDWFNTVNDTGYRSFGSN